MVKIKQNINKSSVAVTPSKMSASVFVGTDSSIYYSNLSKEWACKMPASVDGTEYSAKYYMEKTKQEAIDSKSELQELCTQNISDMNDIKDEAISDLQSAGDEILDSASDIYDQTADKAAEILDLMPSFADNNLSNITTAAINKIIEYGQSGNIGEIVISTVPLTDAGLHLLDGALLSGSGTYAGFVDYIADLYDSGNYSDIFETEANWQTAVTTYGVCGKFVYDSVNDTVRLPKVTGIVEGTTDLTALGDLVQAGLPNITGRTGALYSSNDYTTGALTNTTQISNYGVNPSTSAGSKGRYTDLDASNSNSIYGNSNTVQPQTIKVLYYIVVATSAKTQIQVDIDDIATDLNGKADTDLTNVTNQAKILMSAMGMPSDVYDDLTLGASGATYTAPADGWFAFNKLTTAADQYGNLVNETNGMNTTLSFPTSSSNIRIYLPAKRGDVVKCSYSAAGNLEWFRFVYAKGSESEAI